MTVRKPSKKVAKRGAKKVSGVKSLPAERSAGYSDPRINTLLRDLASLRKDFERARVLAEPKAPPKYRSDQLLITLAADALPRAGITTAAALPDTLRNPFVDLERAGLIEDVTAIAPVARRVPGPRAAASLVASVAPEVDDLFAGVNLVRLAPGASIEEVRRRLDDVPQVREIERVPFRTIVPPARAAMARHAKAGWNLQAIGWRGRNPPDASAIKVAVLDTGVDESHPDLEIASYTHEDTSAEDIVGHGTHVCGIIAGKPSADGKFPGGVCNAQLHVWKIFSDHPDPDTGWYLVDEVLYERALLAVIGEGCRVLNLSIGGSGTTSRERALFKRLSSAGVVVAGAMGNEYLEGNPTEYPAAHDGVIAVGAVGPDANRAGFSNTGNHIAIVAPGVDILSTLPLKTSAERPDEKEYAVWDGTSMATPHVTAAIARLLTKNPTLGPSEAKAELQRTAKKLDGMHGQPWTRVYGAGLLQV